MADDDLTQGLGLDDDELERRSAQYGQNGPSQSAAGPQIPPPGIAKPSANEKTPPVTLRGVTPQTQQRTSDSENELTRLQSTGSGISQIGSPVGRGILKTLDTIGGIAAPGIMRSIPGTEAHHQQLIGQQRGMLGQNLGEETAEAGVAEKSANTGKAEEETKEMPAKAELERAEAQKALNPPPDKPEVPHTVETGDGVFQFNPDTNRYDIKVGAGKAKSETPEQQFIASEVASGIPLAKAIHDYAMASQRPQQGEQGSYLPLYDDKGHVVGAWNPKDDRVRQPPASLPGTTSSGAAIATKAEAAGKKEAQPYQQMVDNAAEAHTLAEMAGKGNASADVDLTLSFFKMMKGAGGQGVRFTQQEQNMILGARSAGQGLVAIGQKVLGEGQPLTPEQRANMVSVMDMHAKAAQAHLQGMQQGGANEKSPDQNDPLGIR